MISRDRRRIGLSLFALLALQSAAAPVAGCAHEFEGRDDVQRELVTKGHTHADGEKEGTGLDRTEGRHHTESHHRVPQSTPVDCLALAACGAPAVGARIATGNMSLGAGVHGKLQGVPDAPAAIVLELTTPPPKV